MNNQGLLLCLAVAPGGVFAVVAIEQAVFYGSMGEVVGLQLGLLVLTIIPCLLAFKIAENKSWGELLRKPQAAGIPGVLSENALLGGMISMVGEAEPGEAEELAIAGAIETQPYETEDKAKRPSLEERVRNIIWSDRASGVGLAVIAAVIIALGAVILGYYGAKGGLSLVKDYTAVGAILVGGLLAYLAFFRTRQRFPRATTEHEISHWVLPSGSKLIEVRVKVENKGSVLLTLGNVVGRAYKIQPWPHDLQKRLDCDKRELEVPWFRMDQREKAYGPHEFELEPGESDEVIMHLNADGDTELACVYTHLTNVLKRNKRVGWCNNTLYDMKTPEPEGEE